MIHHERENFESPLLVSLEALLPYMQPPPEITATVLQESCGNPSKEYGVALFIYRGQPPHIGHTYVLLKTISEIADEVLIAIGSADKDKAQDNPWNADERIYLTHTLLSFAPDVQRRCVGIITINDHEDDGAWLEEVITKAEDIGVAIDVVVSNNPWVIRVFREAELPAREVPLFNVSIQGAEFTNRVNGTEIRQRLIQDGHLPIFE